MFEIFFEVVFIFLLIGLNGLLSMSEIAIVTAKKLRLEQDAKQGNKKAAAALHLANSPGHILSTVQVGITLIGILAGVFGGATIAEFLEHYVRRVPGASDYSSTMSVVLVVISITFFSILFGELIPKRLALGNPERIAATMAGFIKAFSTVAYPAVRILTLSSNAILKLFGAREQVPQAVTEEEVKSLLEEGTRTGVFEEAEQDMVESVLRLGNKPVSSLMTPRTEIIWHDLEDPIERFHEKIDQSSRSVFPIGRGTLDNVLGVVHTKDYLAHTLQKKPIDLQKIVQDTLFILESTPVLKVVDMFKRSGIHIAFIIDEHGVVQGLVTINDILEAIIGDISLSGEPEAVQRGDGSWLIDGLLPLDEFKKIFNISVWPDEEKGHYYTMGGLVVVHLGQIPKVGDRFSWNGFAFEVVDMDGRRVDKIIVTPSIT